MRHYTVAAVMTTDVFTVPAEEPFKNLASLFVGHRISTLPVVGRDGRLTTFTTRSSAGPSGRTPCWSP